MTAPEMMPPDARVWIYQCSRMLNDYEQITIRQRIKIFVGEWTSHKLEVKAWGDVLHNCFVVIMADESDFRLGGCSIDSSVHLIRELDALFNLDLFNRYAVAFETNGETKLASREEFSSLVKNGTVNNSTLVYNNLVATNDEWQHHWLVPLAESWQGRIFG